MGGGDLLRGRDFVQVVFFCWCARARARARVCVCVSVAACMLLFVLFCGIGGERSPET